MFYTAEKGELRKGTFEYILAVTNPKYKRIQK